jgi:hypothetical protein
VPTDALLPHLGDHEDEWRLPTPSFPTSATTRPSGTHDALLPHLGDHEAERRLLPPSDLGAAASSLRRILDADLGGGRMIFFFIFRN